MKAIGIAGTGRLAQAIGRLLMGRGMPIVVIAGRERTRTEKAAQFIGGGARPAAMTELPSLARHVIISVPDDALPEIARELASSGNRLEIALHTSGARGPEVLAPLEAVGTPCGAIHPLQTIAAPDQGVADLPGSYFGITAAGRALEWALELCTAIGGHPLVIPAELRPLYHAAAVIASNYIVTMIDAAVAVMQESGVPRDQALNALAPLIRASVNNSLASGTIQALTGPIERGDRQTIAAHLGALRGVPETMRNLYVSAGLHTVEIARRKNPATDWRAIESLLRGEQEP